MDAERIKEVLGLIVDDCERDANELDNAPFNGRTVGVNLGKQYAAIQALAKINRELLSTIGTLQDEQAELRDAVHTHMATPVDGGAYPHPIKYSVKA